MSVADVALTVAGILLLLFLAAELFMTVLHHWSGSGLLGRFARRAVWTGARRATRGMQPGRRRVILGYVGPLLVLVALMMWGLLAITGFALLYLPWLPGALDAAIGIPRPSTLGDALYYSGVTFFTLGYGDLVPLPGLVRTLAVAEAGTGFALITLGISYFTSVYPAYSQQQVLADSVLAQAGGTADAATVLANHLAGGALPAVLAAELLRLREGMAQVRSDYESYPILYHFVAARPERSLLRLLFVIHELVLLLDTAIDPVRHPVIAGLGERSGLGRSTLLTRKALEDDLLSKPSFPDPDPSGWERRFRCACKILREVGVAVRDDKAAVRAYEKGRREWDPVLRAAANELGEEWIEISGGH